MDRYSNEALFDDDNAESEHHPQQEKDNNGDHNSYYACTRNNYRVLGGLDISERINDAITQLSSVLSASRPEASLLLIHFNWSVNKVVDQWFDNESLVRDKVGLLDKSVNVVRCDESDENVYCGICFESSSRQDFVAALCGHLYCKSCWCGYVSMSVNEDGLGCLKLRCPESSCKAAVTQDMMESLLCEEGKKKLSEFLIRSYIEENRKTKWCTYPGCEHVIEFHGADEASFDVTCRCSNSFCWNCHEECHRPLGCEMVKTWIEKNSSESENMNYILSYCKPCPNCRRPIEKNGGCMIMTCRVCQHSFCWLCLELIQNHTKCNRYVQTNDKTGFKRKEMAMQSLEKYSHYFERWDANRKSKLKALLDLKQEKSVQFKRLSKTQGFPEAQFDFITKAWLQIVECRRVLEWSYAYGYFMPDHETEKKAFFEHLQGVAESTLEKLHNLAEKGLRRFLIDTTSSEDFVTFRKKLEDLTAVTGSYFENLVIALENGLSDISSKNKASSSNSNSSFKDDYEGIWYCDRCTYANLGIDTKCQMCVPFFEDYDPLAVDNF